MHQTAKSAVTQYLRLLPKDLLIGRSKKQYGIMYLVYNIELCSYPT